MRAIPIFLAAALALSLTAAANAYGSDAGRAGEKDPGKLVVTREDGSSFVLRKVRATCGMSDTEPSRPAIFLDSTGIKAGPGGLPATPVLEVEAILADVEKGVTLSLPHAYLYSDPKGAKLFIYDPQGGTVGGNELSSKVEEASGTMTLRGTCRPKPELTLTIDGTLGSELHDLHGVEIRGTIRGTG